MEHLPQLVIDLALLLAAAALATIVCKKLNQPLILGYVLAGFLVSPAIGWIPNVVDSESISTWSEIGVIFLMFGLGLEFSFVKLTKVGKPGIVTALTEMLLMMAAGFLLGMVLGWSFWSSLFLGAMLSISSTTIIVKAFDELGLKGKKFTNLVFGSLVIEDIVGIFIMVVFSTVAVGTSIDGGAIMTQLGTMILYLIIWFVLSVLIVPTLFKKISGALNDEILLIASIALCLIMVVLANAIGFSAALGAFMAGSILAGTVRAHRIEALFKPIKDLFGAVFFVSVGMLVSPQSIVENIIPILLVVVVTLIGKPLFTTIGALLGRQSLKTAVQTGMSLSQIGEFSFIIAALGVSLGVTASFLYPVIVAVSVVTTLSTPFYIKNSERIYKFLKRVLPQNLQRLIETRANGKEVKGQTATSTWPRYLKHWLIKLGMVVVAALAAVMLFSELLSPLLLLIIPAEAAQLIVTGLALVVIGIFVANLYFSLREGDFGKLWVESHRNHLPLLLIMLANLLVSSGMILYAIAALEGFQSLWLIIPALLITLLFARSKTVHSAFLKLENLFIVNLNENTLAEEQASYEDENPTTWVEEQLQVVTVRAHRMRDRMGRAVSLDLAMAQACNLDLLTIRREGALIGADIIPYLTKQELRRKAGSASDKLGICEGDELTFVGTEEEVKAYLASALYDEEADHEYACYLPLKSYLASDGLALDLTCFRLVVDANLECKGKTIAESGMRERYGCLILALEHDMLPTLKPSRNTRISLDDYLWVLGSSKAMQLLSDKDEDSVSGMFAARADV